MEQQRPHPQRALSSHPVVSPDYTLRPARESDIPALNAIHAHYVAHTVATFATTPLSDAGFLAAFGAVRAAGLPYLVAADAFNTPIGYASAAPFRGAEAAYRQTVEFAVFCHPDSTGKGIGSALLQRLLDVLRSPEEWGEDWIGEAWRGDEGRVRQVIGCMALDETGRRGGWGLKEYYEGFGFEHAGTLKEVGRKFGRWIDTVYVQLSL
ncbi:gcn5 family acetyltransferase [Diplodia corticola]|uniref:Gcn5 family acetyltransferase n=1 Tax=Diplodia corticola TaxID=236234 RepID=A0A1J9QTC3_9PEZI|nr:gcn5 family acetyltransferase [Diplodia corticola]OJD32222.1 gcn5 family acetyltransferase [Diplodia corticola]